MSSKLAQSKQILNISGPSGCGKSTLIHDVFNPEIVFRPSDILRQNAEQVLGRQIMSGSDYPTVHDRLTEQNPHFMVDAILAFLKPRNFIVLDGLRRYSLAVALAEIFGKNYHTTILDCPEELCIERVRARSGRPESAPQTVEQYRAAIALPEHYEYENVVRMADTPPEPFDMSGTREDNANRFRQVLSEYDIPWSHHSVSA